MDQCTKTPQELETDDIMFPESSVLLNAAADKGNWTLVRELIEESKVEVRDLRQSCLLQKLSCAKGISPRILENILQGIFKKNYDTESLTKIIKNSVILAAHCDNWDTFVKVLSVADELLDDEAYLLSVIEILASSETLIKMPFLLMDILNHVWNKLKQNILEGKYKKIQDSLLQLAAERSMWSHVCYLLDAKPDLNLLDKDGLSVLHRFVMCPDSRFDSLVPVLLRHGADTNLKSSRGDTVLHLAAKHQKLLETRTSPRNTAVRGANRFKHSSVSQATFDHYNTKHTAMELIIETCTIIEEPDRQGNTAVIVAARNANWEFVRMLLEHGARADVVSDSCGSLLHVLAVNTHHLIPPLTQHLLKLSLIRNAEINGTDGDGNSSLLLAVLHKNWTMAKLLIQQRADLQKHDKEGYTILHRLALTDSDHWKEVVSLFQLLNQKGVSFNCRSRSGKTALHLLAEKVIWNRVRHFAEFGANIHATNAKGLNVLHVLAQNEIISRSCQIQSCGPVENVLSDVVDFLLDTGIELESLCPSGDTALHLAASCGNWTMVKCLVKKGASIHATDSDGLSVMHRIFQSKQEIRKTGDIFCLLFLKGTTTQIQRLAMDTCIQASAINDKRSAGYQRIGFQSESGVKRDNRGNAICNKTEVKQENLPHDQWFPRLQNLLHVHKSLDLFYIHQLIYLAEESGNINFVYRLLQNYDINAMDSEGYSLLHKVVQRCCPSTISLISRLVEEGADLEKKCPNGNTPLHIAAKNSNWSAVTFMLQCGAKGDALDKEGMTVLHRVVTQLHVNNMEHVQFILIDISALYSVAALTADCTLIFQQDLVGNTPLHLAVKYGQWEVAAELLLQGASLDQRDSAGYSVLHRLASCKQAPNKEGLVRSFELRCSENNVESDWFPKRLRYLPRRTLTPAAICNIFTYNTVLIDSPDPQGNTALQLSAKEDNWEIAEILLIKGAKAYLLDSERCSVLHRLASTQNSLGDGVNQRILNHLISHSVCIKARDPEANTALQVAAKHGNMDMVERLLEFQDNVNETDSEGFTLLSRVAQTSSPRCEDIAWCLVEKGADVNKTCRDGRAPLLLSVMAKNWPLALLLYNEGASTVALCHKDQILHWLIESLNSDSGDISFMLIDQILDENEDTLWHRSSDGKSAMQLAFLTRQWVIVEKLCDYQVFIEPEHLVGEYVYHYLADWGKHADDEGRIFTMMQNIKSNLRLNINLRDSNGNTPLNILAEAELWDCVRVFVENGADVNMRDSEGWSALHRLAATRDFENRYCLDLLHLLTSFVKHGANISSIGPNGKTAANVALDARNWEIFWKVVELGGKYVLNEKDKYSVLRHVSPILRTYSSKELPRAAADCIRSCFSNSFISEVDSKKRLSLMKYVFEKCLKKCFWALAREILEWLGDTDVNRLVSGEPLLHRLVSKYRKRDHVVWVSLLDELLKRGADINLPNENGETVLMDFKVLISLLSMTSARDGLTKVLLVRGANPLAIDNRGRSWLSKALCWFGAEIDIVKPFVRMGIVPHQPELTVVESKRSSQFCSWHSFLSDDLTDTYVLKILNEAGACSNSELFHLYTVYQARIAQRNRKDNEDDKILAILRHSATQPRSLKSLCRLVVSRCIPCGLNRRNHVTCLPLPVILQNYLCFGELLEEGGATLESDQTGSTRSEHNSDSSDEESDSSDNYDTSDSYSESDED